MTLRGGKKAQNATFPQCLVIFIFHFCYFAPVSDKCTLCVICCLECEKCALLRSFSHPSQFKVSSANYGSCQTSITFNLCLGKNVFIKK